MAKMKRVALALVFAGGLAVSAPATANAGDDEASERGPGAQCILCWPGWS